MKRFRVIISMTTTAPAMPTSIRPKRHNRRQRQGGNVGPYSCWRGACAVRVPMRSRPSNPRAGMIPKDVAAAPGIAFHAIQQPRAKRVRVARMVYGLWLVLGFIGMKARIAWWQSSAIRHKARERQA